MRIYQLSELLISLPWCLLPHPTISLNGKQNVKPSEALSNCISKIPCTFLVGLFKLHVTAQMKNVYGSFANGNEHTANLYVNLNLPLDSEFISLAGLWPAHCVNNVESMCNNQRSSWMFSSLLPHEVPPSFFSQHLYVCVWDVRAFLSNNCICRGISFHMWIMCVCVWFVASFRHCCRNWYCFCAEVTMPTTISVSDRYFIFRQSTEYNLLWKAVAAFFVRWDSVFFSSFHPELMWPANGARANLVLSQLMRVCIMDSHELPKTKAFLIGSKS